MSTESRLVSGEVAHHGWLSQSSDLVLAMAVMAVITLMILPLPLPLLDGLLAINIAIGVMLVLMGIYVNSPLQFSVFPSVLLISTLFRLALSVATTRMILLHGDAGHIIETFGSLVAGGNLVVGMVVFLIITLVQFLVIAKGAERVAEVGARFTLDAMPGKQMSIDSDLRSGLIDKLEARAKREELELESKLHGSMDGAMKFVKGDAIAGIVIILINLIGGLCIGIFQLGLPADVAMSRYSILTIGDGMVAQIPALFGAMSAGLIVTRVTAENTTEHLGQSIQRQFSAIPRVLMVTGGICLLFALVPGFPSSIFIGIGAILLLTGGMLVPALMQRLESRAHPSFQRLLQKRQAARTPSALVDEMDVVTHSVPLLLELPAAAAHLVHDQDFSSRLHRVMQHWQQESGVRLPRLEFRVRGDETSTWSVQIFEVPVRSGRFDQVKVADRDTQVALLERQLREALRRHAALFMGIQEVSALLTHASNTYPDIVKECLRAIPVQNLAVVFHKLVEEEVPIRNLRGILEALVSASQHEKDTATLVEFARIALSRELCHRYASNDVLQAISLDAALEDLLAGKLHVTAGVTQLAMEPAFMQQLRDALLESIKRHRPQAMVTTVQLRRHLRALISTDAFDTPMLSYNELLPTLELSVQERVAISGVSPLPARNPSTDPATMRSA